MTLMTPSSRTGQHRCLAIILAAMLLLSAGCSQTDTTTTDRDSSTATSATPTGSQDQTRAADNDPEHVFAAYAAAWQVMDFAGLYRMISRSVQAEIGEDAFITRYVNIFTGIEATSIQVIRDAEDISGLAGPDGDRTTIPFRVEMQTLAGPVSIGGYRMDLVLEQQDSRTVWTVDWSEKLIFPNMEAEDKVQARVLQPQRGEILDRNGLGLAVNGDLIVIGIAPGKFAEGKDEAIPQMAMMLGISEERIRKIYDGAKNPDWFYPVVTLPADAGDLSARLTAIDGVMYQKTSGRVYPAGKAAALLIGYIGPITAEELDKRPDEDYTAYDRIGKMGLEQVYEQRLRGTRGGEITVVHGESGQLKDVIARLEPVNGETIQLSIDAMAQYSLYTAMQQDAGAAAAIDPLSGEILALVSTPSFDPNLLQTYVPDQIQQEWNEAVKNPFANRFKVGYAPGSVFKLVTAAIGLKQGTLQPDEAIPISGLKWQPDASWGSYAVTRVKDIGRPVMLSDALLYSDNIYFAQQALRIGAKAFSEGAAGFGIGEELPVDYPFYRSQLANQLLAGDVLLADTGYGQGEVLLSPLHMALFYSSLATQGNLLKPVLELKGPVTPSVWKEQAVRTQDIPLLTEAFLQVVENPAGSGYTKTPAATRMLGKTGTAELKTSLDDTEAEENGWFVAMSIDPNRLTIAMMIEDVRHRGGSRYVVPLVKAAMDEILSD